MQITTSTITKLTITDSPVLDDITVYAEDIEPRRGKITIECAGYSWSYEWGGMGNCTLAEFFCDCDEYYLAKNLGRHIPSSLYDPSAVKTYALRELLKERRQQLIGRDAARERFKDIKVARFDDNPAYNADLLFHIYGDDWRCVLPTKPNPEYTRLCRVILAVQEAFRLQRAPTGTIDATSSANSVLVSKLEPSLMRDSGKVLHS